MKKKIIIALLLATTIVKAEYKKHKVNIDIPEKNFKTVLLANSAINSDGNSEISYKEAASYKGSIDVENKSIVKLTGIEAFTKITELNCNRNELKIIDLSFNITLKKLHCCNNRLQSLDVINNVKLKD